MGYDKDWRTQQGNGPQLTIQRLNPIGVVLCGILSEMGIDTSGWPRVAAEFEQRGFEENVMKKEPEKAENPYYKANRQNLLNWFSEEKGEAPDSFWTWFLEEFGLYRPENRKWLRDLGEVRITGRIPPDYQ